SSNSQAVVHTNTVDKFIHQSATNKRRTLNLRSSSPPPSQKQLSCASCCLPSAAMWWDRMIGIFSAMPTRSRGGTSGRWNECQTRSKETQLRRRNVQENKRNW